MCVCGGGVHVSVKTGDLLCLWNIWELLKFRYFVALPGLLQRISEVPLCLVMHRVAQISVRGRTIN